MENSQRFLDSALVSSMCFFPRRFPLPGCELIQGPAATLACFRIEVDPDLPTVLYFHGNGEVVADYIPELGNLLAGAGVNVFLAEYRGYGGSTGEPALAGMLEDVPCLVEAAAQGGGLQRLIVFGRSIGSLYALEAAARFPEIGGLILESAIADPLELFSRYAPLSELGPVGEVLRREVAECFDQQRKLASYPREVLIMHTQNDEIVPVEHARRLERWARSAANCRLKIFAAGGHNGILSANRDAYLAAVADLAREVERRAND